MLAKWLKRAFLALALALIVAGFAWLMWPEPVAVDVTMATVGHMEVTVDEEGVNRIREVYVVSAPVGGKVERSPREVGDRVTAGVTTVAAIRPADPSILDVRTRQELLAAVEAVKAMQDLAAAALTQAETALAFAQQEFDRALYLSSKKVIAISALEKRQLERDTARQQVATAKAQLDARQHDLEVAEARLKGPVNTAAEEGCCVVVTAPVNGMVLRVPVESEQIVQAGTPLIEIGNPLYTEIAVDLLSTDAVQVTIGAPARISGWGGTDELKARVKRIDPAAFTKISALGIEEQRVKVVLDIADPPAGSTGLGHEYRVFVHISVWQSDNALQVPLGALFRDRGTWAMFKASGGFARLTPVRVGHINAGQAEILGGLSAGEPVIVHPSDTVEDGIAIAIRPPAP
jgi:HlyD family secretion protein